MEAEDNLRPVLPSRYYRTFAHLHPGIGEKTNGNNHHRRCAGVDKIGIFFLRILPPKENVAATESLAVPSRGFFYVFFIGVCSLYILVFFHAVRRPRTRKSGGE